MKKYLIALLVAASLAVAAKEAYACMFICHLDPSGQPYCECL